MTNLGMKIVGEEMEVGFTVSSREEFDQAVGRLQTVAATLWPASAAAQEKPGAIGGEVDLTAPPTDRFVGLSGYDFGLAERLKQFRESQGLR